MISETSCREVPIRNIAVATDFGPWSDQAARHALVVARQFGAVVHFIHAIRRNEFTLVPDLMVELGEVASRDCEDFIARLAGVENLEGIETRCWNLNGELWEVFGPMVAQQQIDLLVLGTRGRNGIFRYLFGSMAEEICRSVSCPVLTVGPSSRRPSKRLAVKRVLLVTDLSATSRAAIPYVLTAARRWGAEIDVLKFGSPDHSLLPVMEELSRAVKPGATSAEPVFIRCHAATGKLSAAVLNTAKREGDDLIVLGLGREHSLYGTESGGSDPHEIVCGAPCPVLSVCSAPQALSTWRANHEPEQAEPKIA